MPPQQARLLKNVHCRVAEQLALNAKVVCVTFGQLQDVADNALQVEHATLTDMVLEPRGGARDVQPLEDGQEDHALHRLC